MKKKEIVINFLLVAFAILFTYLFSYYFGLLFSFAGGSRGSFVDMTYIVGMPEAYLAAVMFLFTAFGRGSKRVWLFVLLIPVVLIQAFDPFHIYFPIAVSLISWGLGVGVKKGIEMISIKSKANKKPTITN